MPQNLLTPNFLTRTLLTLAAAALLAPLTASAQTPPAPAAPASPAAPAARTHPNDRVHGKITSVDAAKRTVTLTQHKVATTLTLSDTAKIYKIGDTRRDPTGTFADLAVGTQIVARITGDPASPTATEVHLRVPKAAKPATDKPVTDPVAPATAVPAAPAQ